MKKFLKWITDFKKSGFNVKRLKRMRESCITRVAECCIECGENFEFGEHKIRVPAHTIQLVGNIIAGQFCSRKCWNKFMMRL